MLFLQRSVINLKCTYRLLLHRGRNANAATGRGRLHFALATAAADRLHAGQEERGAEEFVEQRSGRLILVRIALLANYKNI